MKTILHNLTCYPAYIYLIKVDNGDTRTMFEIYSKSTVETPKEHMKSVQN